MSDVSKGGERLLHKNVSENILKFVGISVLSVAVIALLFYGLAKGIKFVQLNKINRRYSKLCKDLDLKNLKAAVEENVELRFKTEDFGKKEKIDGDFRTYVDNLVSEIKYFRGDDYSDSRFVDAANGLKDCIIDLRKKVFSLKFFERKYKKKEELETKKEQLEFFKDSLLLLSFEDENLGKELNKYALNKSKEEIEKKNRERHKKTCITSKECKEIIGNLKSGEFLFSLKSGEFLFSLKNEKIRSLSENLVKDTVSFGAFIEMGSDQNLLECMSLSSQECNLVGQYFVCLCELINEIDVSLSSIKFTMDIEDYKSAKEQLGKTEKELDLELNDVRDKLKTRVDDRSEILKGKNSLEVYKSLGEHFFGSKDMQGE